MALTLPLSDLQFTVRSLIVTLSASDKFMPACPETEKFPVSITVASALALYGNAVHRNAEAARWP